MPFYIMIHPLISPLNLPGNGKSMCGYEQPLSDFGHKQALWRGDLHLSAPV